MPRSPHLPPRSPSRSRGVPRRSFDGASQSPPNEPHRSHSHTPLLDEEPLWLDDLLSDRETRSSGLSLNKSSSHSVVLREVATSIHGPVLPVYEEHALLDSLFDEPVEADQVYEEYALPNSPFDEPVEADQARAIVHDSDSEASGCFYGPHSPRQKKDKLTNSEISLMAALREHFHSTDPQYFTDYPSTSATGHPLGREDDYTPPASAGSGRFSRMRAGQRARVRKVQRIATLEKRVEFFQNLGARLSADLAGMSQTRLSLFHENKGLRQRIASLQLEKTVKDGQHQSLMKEVELLRRRQRRRGAVPRDTGLPAIDPPQVARQMQNRGKLGRGGT